MVLQLQGTMMKMENFQKLLELRKDLTGIDNLAIPGRVRLSSPAGHMTTLSVAPLHLMFVFVFQEFIRLGCLSKLSGKGLQQRMFFLVRASSCFLHRQADFSCSHNNNNTNTCSPLALTSSVTAWSTPAGE